MSNYIRRRKTGSADLQKAAKEAIKPEMARINLWVPKTDYDRLKIEAVKKGLTISDIMRDMIKEYT